MIFLPFDLLRWLGLLVGPIVFGVVNNGGPEPPPDPPPPPPPPGDGGSGSGSGGINVYTGSRSLQSIDQSGHTATYRILTNSFNGNSSNNNIRMRTHFYVNGGNPVQTNANGTTTASSQQWSSNANGQSDWPAPADNTLCSFRARIQNLTTGATINGGTTTFKSDAVDATSSTPTADFIEAHQADIHASFFPNTLHSTCTASLQYKKASDSTWTVARTGNTAGYSQQTISQTITGLTAETTYQIRVVLTRTTNNSTSHTSATGSFVTLADVPTVTTNAASSVAATTATLNGTIDPNNISSRVRFGWGTSDAGAGTWANYTSYQAFSGDGNQAFTANLSGLTASTLYYFRALAEYPDPTFGTTVQGSSLSFTTAASPGAGAANEAHVHIYNYDGTYGAATDIYFTLSSPAATSSDRLVTTAPGSLFAAGDIKISKDGGAFGNVANSVSQVAASNPLYKLTLSTSEMQAELALVQIVDQDGPAFRDQLWIVRTKQRLGQLFIDASNLTNSTAVTFTGIGSGHGLSCVAGATGKDIDGVMAEMTMRHNTATAGGASTITLDASASAVDSYYNGSAIMIIGGTGAGQFRIITAYVGSTQVATVNRSWSTNPANGSVFLILPASEVWDIASAAELASLPTSTSAFSKFLQFLFQRFAYKRTQTATTFTMFKADSSTSLTTGTVADDGTTQSAGKLS